MLRQGYCFHSEIWGVKWEERRWEEMCPLERRTRMEVEEAQRRHEHEQAVKAGWVMRKARRYTFTLR
jgi:hypothetical protein